MANHPNRSRTVYTWERKYAAWYRDFTVTVPDQVAEDQKGYARRNQTFPVIGVGGAKARARIDAEATGLFTGGTGDLVVKGA